MEEGIRLFEFKLPATLNTGDVDLTPAHTLISFQVKSDRLAMNPRCGRVIADFISVKPSSIDFLTTGFYSSPGAGLGKRDPGSVELSPMYTRYYQKLWLFRYFPADEPKKYCETAYHLDLSVWRSGSTQAMRMGRSPA